jgi:pyruvate,orthophosphate dikinase
MTGNPRLAWDSYRRLIQSFAEVVHDGDMLVFTAILAECTAQAGVADLRELDALRLRKLCHALLDAYRAATGEDFPQNPMAQLIAATEAVFRSWRSPRAREYRRMHAIDEGLGTAVTIQSMVFGNGGGNSGSGVGFTRNPATGANELFLDFLNNAQGEDVVGGRLQIKDRDQLQRHLPELLGRLESVKRKLEREFRDLQDFEFTVEDGELYLLQTRSGRLTPWATLQVTADLVDEGVLTQHEALQRLEVLDLQRIQRKRLKTQEGQLPLAVAVPASIGVACGRIALDSERARQLSEQGEPVILVRAETSTDDIVGMAHADGILTAAGGRTSHAAVVARQLNKVCLVGCAPLLIDAEKHLVWFDQQALAEGDYLTIDGDQGTVFAGCLKSEQERPVHLLERIEAWRRELEGAEPAV